MTKPEINKQISDYKSELENIRDWVLLNGRTTSDSELFTKLSQASKIRKEIQILINKKRML